MEYHWALYDPSYFSPDGKSYWTWHAPQLSTSLLERFYYDVAAKKIPQNPNAVTPNDVFGGVVRFDGVWTVAYRFLDGGRDKQGRPGRFVLLTAWGKPCATEGHDVPGNIIRHPFFSEIGSIAATTIPIPPPIDFTFRLEEQPIENMRTNGIAGAPSSLQSDKMHAMQQSDNDNSSIGMIGINSGSVTPPSLSFSASDGKMGTASSDVSSCQSPQRKSSATGLILVVVCLVFLIWYIAERYSVDTGSIIVQQQLDVPTINDKYLSSGRLTTQTEETSNNDENDDTVTESTNTQEEQDKSDVLIVPVK